MLPRQVKHTKKAISRIHRKNNLDIATNVSSVQVLIFIEWLECEWHQQETRIREADVGYILTDMLRGLKTSCVLNKYYIDKPIISDETLLYCFIERLSQYQDLDKKAPVASQILERINQFLNS
jgi:hypothetical protein